MNFIKVLIIKRNLHSHYRYKKYKLNVIKPFDFQPFSFTIRYLCQKPLLFHRKKQIRWIIRLKCVALPPFVFVPRFCKSRQM